MNDEWQLIFTVLLVAVFSVTVGILRQS